jgi:hypothetical protein
MHDGGGVDVGVGIVHCLIGVHNSTSSA